MKGIVPTITSLQFLLGLFFGGISTTIVGTASLYFYFDSPKIFALIDGNFFQTCAIIAAAITGFLVVKWQNNHAKELKSKSHRDLLHDVVATKATYLLAATFDMKETNNKLAEYLVCFYTLKSLGIFDCFWVSRPEYLESLNSQEKLQLESFTFQLLILLNCAALLEQRHINGSDNEQMIASLIVKFDKHISAAKEAAFNFKKAMKQ